MTVCRSVGLIVSIVKIIQTLIIAFICFAFLEGIIVTSLYVPGVYKIMPAVAQDAISKIYTKHG